jgi:hypothetical protein
MSNSPNPPSFLKSATCFNFFCRPDKIILILSKKPKKILFDLLDIAFRIIAKILLGSQLK